MVTEGMSPNQGPVTAPAAPLSAGLSDRERRTIARALALIKAGRAEIASEDPKVAEAAERRLAIASGYLVGLLDAKGMIPFLNPGFVAAFGAPRESDPEAALDKVEESLEELLDPTRKLAGIIVGGLILALGQYLLAT